MDGSLGGGGGVASNAPLRPPKGRDDRTVVSAYGGLTPVMELEAEDGASASGTTITLFGTDRSGLRRLGAVRREIHVEPIVGVAECRRTPSAVAYRSHVSPAQPT